MVEFKTLISREVQFGNDNFIEVTKKKAISDDGENLFFSLSRGFFNQAGERRYKKNFAIPDDGQTVKDVLDALQEVLEEDQETGVPAAQPESEREDDEEIQEAPEEEAQQEPADEDAAEAASEDELEDEDLEVTASKPESDDSQELEEVEIEIEEEAA